ncbi:MAG TPA: alpha/beta hydrolase-fold protein [Candidatus Paceibacterota bacterium]|nr:alpha/beta hydrolase-fold protein [Candidatus Paceibacterota bacterium]
MKMCFIATMSAIALRLACLGDPPPQETAFPLTNAETGRVGSGLTLPAVAARVDEPVVDASGMVRYAIRSPYQQGQTTVRFLAPPEGASGAEHRFLFVLPVEPGAANRYGDGLLEVLQHRLHIRHHLVVVAPSFSDWPWYADHPTNALIRQETYLLKTILPLADRLYPTPHPRRLLLGFSKSGWGAMTLILRHPDLFDAACVWDAPLMMDQPGRYNSGPIFHTQENFDRYRVSRLLRENAGAFRAVQRIGLMGCCNFGDHMRQTHDLLDRLGIPHVYIDRTRKTHAWDSGWVEDAVDQLVAMAGSSSSHPPGPGPGVRR